MILRYDCLRSDYLLVKLKLPCRKIDCFDLTKDRKTAKEVRVTDMNLFKNSYVNGFMQSETENEDML